MKKYDLIVIGAGSAGLVAATTAHRAGLKTALIEKRKIGGECTHSGCVPSKAILNLAKSYSAVNHINEIGFATVKKSKVKFEKVMEHVHSIIDGIYEHETPDIFQKMGIDTIVDTAGAVFIDANTIKIGRKKLAFKNCIICTGSSPRIIPFKGSEDTTFLTNDNFWEIKKQPKSIVFIGGGVISVELGSALAQMGTKVTILEVAPRILGAVDEEVATYMTKVLEDQGIKIITNVNILSFNKEKVSLEVEGKKKTIKADAYFQAVGRVPNVSSLGLEEVGIKYDRKGLTTNRYLQTNLKHIYACGDCTTPFKFTHTASHQANICVHNVLNKKKKINDLTVLPWAVFTNPEIGHVGLTEQEAKDKFGAENIAVFKVNASIDRYITDQKTGGFLKVIFNKKDRVIGADAVGTHAGEWIQLLTIAIKNNIPAAKMADTIFPYPTYGEIVKKAFTRYLRTKK